MSEDELSEEQQAAISETVNQLIGATQPEAKHNVHTFLHAVATSDDTTKTGYLKDEEVGVPKHPVRALKEFSLIATEIMDNDFIGKYFQKESEVVTATSLSRDGFLDKLAITSTKQIADVTKHKKENKGWWGKKKEEKDENSTE